MFFKNRKPQKDNLVCNTNNNLNECSIVERIRLLQKQISEIGDLRIENILKKYIDDSTMLGYTDVVYRLSNFLTYKRNPQSGFTTYEEMFQSMGKELDVYFNKYNLQINLSIELKAEKDKLGIK